MAAAKENLDNGLILTIGILLVVLTFVLILLVQGWFYKAQTEERVRKVIEPRSEELASVVAQQQETLHSYKVMDTEKGTVAIPIERAMELVVREGL
jgi:sensor histidine kinase regulating citrate/malate metabolism